MNAAGSKGNECRKKDETTTNYNANGRLPYNSSPFISSPVISSRSFRLLVILSPVISSPGHLRSFDLHELLQIQL
jgi:hypothetical protein